jgi:serine/threonine-protein kinase RsbW
MPCVMTPDPGDVEVRMRVDADHLTVLTAVASAVALRDDFDIDTVQDMRLAVAEMCATLLRLAARPESMLTCCFGVTGHTFRVHADVEPARPGQVDHHTFGWHALTVLADSVTEWTDGDPAGHAFHLEIQKRRGSRAGPTAIGGVPG